MGNSFSINKADLQKILDQIKIAEAHAAGTPLTDLVGSPMLPWGLRTVDGSYNNFLDGREQWGAADGMMPRLLDGSFLNDTDGDSIDFNGPGNPGGVVVAGNYANPGNIIDADPRIISNLIVDMSINNPAAVEAWFSNELAVAAFEEKYPGMEPVRPGTVPSATQQVITNEDLAIIHNIAPDEGLSAGFNAWMTFFGQFFDHGLDLIPKGGNGTVYIPLAADDPLRTHGPDGIAGSGDEVPAQMAFMVMTRATPGLVGPGPDGVEGTADDVTEIPNTTSPFVDQNQTYTSHASHQVFVRQYVATANGPLATGHLLDGHNPDGSVGGLPTWADVKHQAATVLGIQLTDGDVLNIPLLRTDAYGEFIRGPNGFPQLVLGIGPDGVPNTGDDIVVEGDPADPINTFTATTTVTIAGVSQTFTGAVRIGHAFLDDIAHAAAPNGMADSDSGVNGATQIALFNNSFEMDSMATGAPNVVEDSVRGNYAQIDPQGWDVTGFGGVFAPTTTVIAATGHTGGNVVFLDNYATLIRNTGVTLQTGQTYQLTFNVGDRLDTDFAGGTVILRTAGGTVLATSALATPVDGAWAPVTLNTGAVLAAVNGQELTIEIVHGGSGQVLIDNVQLTAGNPQPVGTYDNELLDAHFITGDGRGNENIGLSAVHHIFHSEHNRTVEQNKLTILETGDAAFINEWLLTDVASTLTVGELKALNLAGELQWDGERLFQAARFTTEMQYQHLVFEEFARKIQPNIDVFVFNTSPDVDPSIFAEFAHAVYRFGHSMLTPDIARINADGTSNDVGLVEAFLNPAEFFNSGGTTPYTADQAVGAIVRGLTNQKGNAIDEFVVGDLRNNLLGLPLDLAAINIARGRDTGLPTLNEARAQLYAASSSSFLKPYESWADLASNLKNPMSIVNFIAAYGQHQTILDAVTLADKRAAAFDLVLGGGAVSDAERMDFLHSTGAWTAASSGLNSIDLWIGGLAEKVMPFGGMLGSTFNAVFELQLENLQEGDRFYYLSRTQGMNLLTSLEDNAFSKLIMRNTDLAQPGPDGIRGTQDDIITRHIGVDSFADYDHVLEVNIANQLEADPTGNNPVLEAMGLGKVIRNDPGTAGPDANYIRFTGGEHIVIGGTNDNDTIISDFGDDAIWGDAGDDRIESGAGVDLVMGGAGNDIITDSGDTGDFLKGDDGDDVIANSNGLDILMGGAGNDVFFVGVDATEVFAGLGDDFVLGGEDADFLIGGEGSDWMEAGGGFDTTAGDNSELFFNSAILGHDVMFAGDNEHDFDAESGDDIMVQGESVMRNEGMFGFDWSIFKGSNIDGYADMRIQIFTTDEADILRNRFDKTEALSGWNRNDTLIGDDRVVGDEDPDEPVVTTEGFFFNDELTQAGVNRIDGLRALLGNLIEAAEAGATAEELEAATAFTGGNILLGGGGSDVLEGNAGDDVLDGDAWLNVRIRITNNAGDANTQGNQLTSVDSLKHVFSATDGVPSTWVGKSVFELMVARVIVPAQLHIVREIVVDDGVNDTDVAVFNDNLFDEDGNPNYSIVTNPDGTVTVEHINVSNIDDPATGRQLLSDGVDTLRNIEVLRFLDGDFRVSPPQLQLNGFDLSAATWADNFNSASYANNGGNRTFTSDWVEAGDSGAAQSPSDGSIRIAGNPLGTLRFLAGNSDGSSITRSLDLSNAQSATVTFSISDTSVSESSDDEEIIFEFAANGVDFVTVQTFHGSNGGTGLSFDLPTTAEFTASAAIRFRSVNSLDSGELFQIDNLSISANILGPATAPSVNHTFNYPEQAPAQSIGSLPDISSPNQLASARIVLTNAQAGDSLNVGSLAGLGITATTALVAGQIVVTLTGLASQAAYERAIQAVTFSNASDNPGGGPRTIQVTVSDGFFDSNVATTTVNVQPINDPFVAGADRIVTNVAGANFVVPEWVLLANDGDPDTSVVADITAVTESSSIFTATLLAGNAGVQINDGDGSNNSFTYTANGGATANVAVVRDTGNVTGGGGSDILVGDGAGNTFNGVAGNDFVFAGAGNDTIIQVATEGRDFIDGQGGTDTYQLNGTAGAEAFIVYTRAAAATAITGGTLTSSVALALATEIVIARNGVVIAELDNIEEISVNALNVTANDGGGLNQGTNGGDTIQVIGNFTGTSLNFSTITIDGSEGDDTIDISGLQSAHRIVFRSNGGHDTIVGTLRPQDVIELPDGTTIADYEMTIDEETDVATLTGADYSISFSVASGMPEIGSGSDDQDDNDDEDDDPVIDDEDTGDDEDDDDDAGAGSGSDDGEGSSQSTGVGLTLAGTAVADVLIGTAYADTIIALGSGDNVLGGAGDDVIRGDDGGDFLSGDAGRDMIFGGADNDDILGGADNDMLYGDAGEDRLFGGSGNDLLDGGSGNDNVDGGEGDDVFLASLGDDVFTGGAGSDTLNMASITGNATVNLGGSSGYGSAVSAQSGSDTLWGVENVTTGSGNDTITASNAVNVMDGGAGNDTFRFLSAADADGDTILGFQPGDRLDFSGIDANAGTAGNQAFTLASGSGFTGPGQISVTQEMRDDGEYTIVSGNTSGADQPEFRLSIKGAHNLVQSDFDF